VGFFRKKAESHLEREIAHHLHELTAAYERQGYSHDEAARLAKRDFGGGEQIKEQCRDQWRFAWMTGWWQDIVFGFRQMRRTPAVTSAAVLTLALGIGAKTAIVSLTDVVLWRELPVPNPKQLSLVHWQAHGYPRELADAGSGSFIREEGRQVGDFFSYLAFQEMRRAVSGRASLAAFTYPNEVSVSFEGRPTVAQARAVSGNFLSTLGVRPQLGRLFSESDDRNAAPATVVLSHRFWVRTLGAKPEVVGRAMTINSKPYVIVGVLEPPFYGLFPGDPTEIYVPAHHGGVAVADDRYWGVSLIARRFPNVTQAQLHSVLATVFPSTWSVQPKDASATPQIRLDDGSRGLGSLRREFRNPLLVLGGLATLLLVIACTNIASLLLARGIARQKEVAMRVSLGCSQGRLIRQFLTESALLALLGGGFSIGVAYLTANVLGKFLANNWTIPIAVALDARILGIVGIVTAAALLVFGIFPAWQGARSPKAEWLRYGPGSIGYAGHQKWNAGRVLVIAQMAMSVVLVMTAVVFTRNLLAVQSSDPGFDRRNLILFDIRPGTSGYDESELLRFYFQLEQKLSATPGVAGAGLALMRPMNIGGWWEPVALAGENEVYQASINAVTPAYLPLYAPNVVAGRNLTWADINAEAKVAVISEDLARKLGGPSVLGRRLVFAVDRKERPEFAIVGIAPAIAATSMKERPYVVWLPLGKKSERATVVVRTSQPPQAVLPTIRHAMSEIDRNLPMVDVATMEEQISKGLYRERMFATLCDGFGILALVRAVVGLYGVMAYSTSRRRGEIGIRLALGAMPRDVVSMVLREGLLLAGVGLLLGLPVVFWGAAYVEKDLFQMKPLEPASLLIALGILFMAALVSAGIPALRAAAIQPAETLRQE
jgi:Acidobacterial duplicated orphan permease